MDSHPQIHFAAVEARGEQQQRAAPAQAPAPRRTKADALRIARRLKRGAAVAAMLGFSVFGVTIGSHLAATSTSATAAAHTTTTSSAKSSSSSTSSGGFLSQSGGSSFSSSSSSSSSTPVTSTGVS